MDAVPTDEAAVRRPPFGSNPLVGERGSDTRRRVLASALEVFAETPYPEARVEQITERAGCSRPAFYQYFSSKDDVFWALASELGREIVALDRQLGRLSADAEGLADLTAWVRSFMALHEAWAPVFSSFRAASRGHSTRVSGSASISDHTGKALLRAFDVSPTADHKRLASSLVVVLIRCSLYAEHAPAGMSRSPLVVGVGQLFHRVLVGPIDGVNVVRERPGRRRRIRIVAAAEPTRPAPLRPRGEQTRQRLLSAGSVVLPASGYHETRVDDIVAAARVSHGTFYRYFDSKDHFFRALAEAASIRMIDLVDRLDLNAPPPELRTWLEDWFDAYAIDGGVLSTLSDMGTSAELEAFSEQVAASLFTRLDKLLDARDFGQPQVDAAMLLALLERVPYMVNTLGFTSRSAAIDAAATVIRLGFLGLDEP